MHSHRSERGLNAGGAADNGRMRRRPDNPVRNRQSSQMEIPYAALLSSGFFHLLVRVAQCVDRIMGLVLDPLATPVMARLITLEYVRWPPMKSKNPGPLSCLVSLEIAEVWLS